MLAIFRHGLDLCPENILFDVIYHVHTQDAHKAQQTLERKPKKSKGSDFSKTGQTIKQNLKSSIVQK